MNATKEAQPNIPETRAHYVDNLRWLCILIIIPYHCAMAWNSFGDGNYILFEADKIMSSFLTLIAPWIMPLLFLLAGIGASYSLKKRTYKQFCLERVTKLLLPLVAGTLLIVPIMTYYADVSNCGYDGTFLAHYKVFFTTFTDTTGYDGGFSPAHLWFLLFLYVISMLCLGIIALIKKFRPNFINVGVAYPVLAVFAVIITLTNPLKLFGRPVLTYILLYLVGYYVFSAEKTLSETVKYKFISLSIFILSSAANVYLFIWSPWNNLYLNLTTNGLACWFGILSLLGFAKPYFNQNNIFTTFMRKRAFLTYIFHFVFIIIIQYYFAKLGVSGYALLFLSIIGCFALTFCVQESIYRIPILRFLFGISAPHKKTTRKDRRNVNAV